MSETKADMVRIDGNTYPMREQLKALGGRWDGETRCWRVPADRAAEAQALVGAATERAARTKVCWECGCPRTYAEVKRQGGDWNDDVLGDGNSCYCGC